MQLVQKPSPEADQAAADSASANMAAAKPMTAASGITSNPSNSDAATAMEGVVEGESRGMGDGKEEESTSQKVQLGSV